MFQVAVKNNPVPHSLEVKTDGAEAIAYLASLQRTAYTDPASLPDLILLDIKMPKADGHEVLQWVRHQLQFLAVPVVMLTSSNSRDDIVKSLGLGANSFLSKTGDITEYRNILELTLKYWLQIHQRPTAR
ncbi:MAG: response regulator receiver protein [Pedosphaera sp.]|nr:response regulator receiver protein [Pedosphaera sp.]